MSVSARSARAKLDMACPSCAPQYRLAGSREGHERGTETYGLQLLGEIASRREPPDIGEAEARYLEGLALAVELGMRPLVAHCHLGLGNLFRRTGQREQAQEHLATATTMYREMGMTYWLDNATKEFEAV
jgi:hypothetical protein